MTDVSKSKFGITEETKSKNTVPLKVTSLHPINSVLMTKVAFEDIKKKDETTTKAIVFYFEDASKERSHREAEWILDETDLKFNNKLEAFQSRIKHIYDEFAPFPKDGIGKDALNLEEFYSAIEKAFNTNGKDGQPIFTNVPCYLKLVYYKGNLKFPYAPNFIEKIRYDDKKNIKLTNLVINPKYDIVDNDAVTSNTTTTINNSSEFTEDTNFDSFPN